MAWRPPSALSLHRAGRHKTSSARRTWLSPALEAVVAEYETSEGRSAIQEALRKRFAGAKPGDAVQRSLDNLREVSAILAAKAPGDAPSPCEQDVDCAHDASDETCSRESRHFRSI
jgi:hypothetical protein